MKPSELKLPLGNIKTLGDLRDFMDAAAEAAHALMTEVEFTYSHPDAAMRGEVWVDRQKVPKLYQAYWKLQRFMTDDLFLKGKKKGV
jgi:hypothetical protein